ncbi:MAG: Nif3-like dinuclear metal center hexameric protein [bacterium]|nr:Nif3-like dinuclear metal center hexameric protein [bacterium]
MIKLGELTHYLNDHLNCAEFNDYAPNGLQIEGKESINRICTAVTASEEAISAAVTLHADALIVHHGFFWRNENPVITGMKQRRISKLLKNDMSLLAYHLPLDCHATLGNNACIAKLLSLSSVKMHGVNSIKNLLWSGYLPQAMSGVQLSEFIATRFNRTPLYIAAHDQAIKSIAWCSGGAQNYIVEAHALGVDAYLSGEVSEKTYYQAKELGIHYYSCGHHATERYGVQALGDYLATNFALEHIYIESDNPI